jgi:hypothetical protein
MEFWMGPNPISLIPLVAKALVLINTAAMMQMMLMNSDILLVFFMDSPFVSN